MEMRWEKLYSGGLGEFTSSDYAFFRRARRGRALEAGGLVAVLTVLLAGIVVILN